MASPTYRWLFLTLVCVGLAADQASKYAVFRWLYRDGVWMDGHGNSYDIVPGWFQLIAQYDPTEPFATDWREPLQRFNAAVMPRVNHGALFGMGQSHRERANMIFSLISGLAALVIIVWGWHRSVASDCWLSAALGLILAGTLGNFYDRLVFGGVRDFLYFYKINWPVFNVADCCLVCGASLLFFHAFVIQPSDSSHRSESESAARKCSPSTTVEPHSTTVEPHSSGVEVGPPPPTSETGSASSPPTTWATLPPPRLDASATVPRNNSSTPDRPA
jgi:lipoprotein signal peptidase